MNKEKLKDDLKKVADISRDGVNGYEAAANNIEKDDVKTLFLRLAQQRKGFIAKLNDEALNLGFEISDSGTVKGFFHRTWLATKSTFSSDTLKKVVEEAKTGEKKALEIYTDVLADPQVPDYIKATLEEQKKLIKGSIEQLEGLKAE